MDSEGKASEEASGSIQLTSELMTEIVDGIQSASERNTRDEMLRNTEGITRQEKYNYKRIMKEGLGARDKKGTEPKESLWKRRLTSLVKGM